MLDASYCVAVLGVVRDIAVLIGGKVYETVGAIVDACYAATPEVARSINR